MSEKNNIQGDSGENTSNPVAAGIIEWFARNSVAANLLMVFIVIAGLTSAWMIKKKIFPDFDINTVQVEVVYPGAGPDDIEQGIVFKIEESVRDISGIKKIISIAGKGLVGSL